MSAGSVGLSRSYIILEDLAMLPPPNGAAALAMWELNPFWCAGTIWAVHPALEDQLVHLIPKLPASRAAAVLNHLGDRLPLRTRLEVARVENRKSVFNADLAAAAARMLSDEELADKAVRLRGDLSLLEAAVYANRTLPPQAFQRIVRAAAPSYRDAAALLAAALCPDADPTDRLFSVGAFDCAYQSYAPARSRLAQDQALREAVRDMAKLGDDPRLPRLLRSGGKSLIAAMLLYPYDDLSDLVEALCEPDHPVQRLDIGRYQISRAAWLSPALGAQVAVRLNEYASQLDERLYRNPALLVAVMRGEVEPSDDVKSDVSAFRLPGETTVPSLFRSGAVDDLLVRIGSYPYWQPPLPVVRIRSVQDRPNRFGPVAETLERATALCDDDVERWRILFQLAKTHNDMGVALTLAETAFG